MPAPCSAAEKWRFTLFTPGHDPWPSCIFQMSRTLPGGKSPVALDDLLARPTMARHLGRSNGSEQPLVICIDQFEELFTLAPVAQRSKFIAALSAMTDPADSQVRNRHRHPRRFLRGLRADSVAGGADHGEPGAGWPDDRFRAAPRPSPNLPGGAASISSAIWWTPFWPRRATRPARLPLVAHVLVETWMRRQGNTLTLEGFREAGGVAGAISQTADATFEHRFSSAEKEATKRLFLRLVNPGEGTPDTRRALDRAEVENDQPDIMRRVVECLTEARLLTVDDATVQIAHEALLHSWPRLHSWIEDYRDDLRTRQRISHAAAEWNDEQRDPDLLYRGTPLLSALEMDGRRTRVSSASWIAPSSMPRRRPRLKPKRSRRKKNGERASSRRLAGRGSLLPRGRAPRPASIVAFLAVSRMPCRTSSAPSWRRSRHASALPEHWCGGEGASSMTNPLLALALAAEQPNAANRDRRDMTLAPP
jgi:hypothetical protein